MSARHGTTLRRFERLAVTRVTVVEGQGVVDDPVREVNYYFDAAGKLLWDDDRYGPAEYGKLDEIPNWGLERLAESLAGQMHNPAIASLLDAVALVRSRRQVPA